MNKMNVNIGFKCVEDMTILTTTVGTWNILDKFICKIEVTKFNLNRKGERT